MAGNYVSALMMDPDTFASPATVRTMMSSTPYKTVSGAMQQRRTKLLIHLHALSKAKGGTSWSCVYSYSTSRVYSYEYLVSV